MAGVKAILDWPELESDVGDIQYAFARERGFEEIEKQAGTRTREIRLALWLNIVDAGKKWETVEEASSRVMPVLRTKSKCRMVGTSLPLFCDS